MLISDVLNRIDDSGAIEQDEVSYDEIEHVDGDFATVWTPYRFFEDVKVSCDILNPHRELSKPEKWSKR